MKEKELNYKNMSMENLQKVVDSKNPHWGKIILLFSHGFENKTSLGYAFEDNPSGFWMRYNAYFEDGVMRRYSPSSEKISGLPYKFYEKYRWYNAKTRQVLTNAIEAEKDVEPICVKKGDKLYYPKK